jgi:hypothetical protein
VDSDWTLSPLDWDWTLKSGLQSSWSPVDWTGLDWTGLESSGLGIAPANLAWQESHWNPLESTRVHMDYVGEGKDLVVSCCWGGVT